MSLDESRRAWASRSSKQSSVIRADQQHDAAGFHTFLHHHHLWVFRGSSGVIVSRIEWLEA